MSPKSTLAASALATIVLVAAGCGGSSSTSSSTSTPVPVNPASGQPLTAAALIAKADAICARVNELRGTTTVSTPESMAQLLPTLAANEQKALTELRSLTPPTAIANDWRQVLASHQTIAEYTAKLGQYATEKNSKAVRQVLSKSGALTSPALLAGARRDGFKACSQTTE